MAPAVTGPTVTRAPGAGTPFTVTHPEICPDVTAFRRFSSVTALPPLPSPTPK